MFYRKTINRHVKIIGLWPGGTVVALNHIRGSKKKSGVNDGAFVNYLLHWLLINIINLLTFVVYSLTHTQSHVLPPASNS